MEISGRGMRGEKRSWADPKIHKRGESTMYGERYRWGGGRGGGEGEKR